MKGKLVEDHGRMVCVSCYLWNHWHQRGEPCDIDGCQCRLSAEYQFRSRWPGRVSVHN